MELGVGFGLALALQPTEIGGSRTSVSSWYALLAAAQAARAGRFAIAFGLCLCTSFAGNGARCQRLGDGEDGVPRGVNGLNVSLKKVFPVEGGVTCGTAERLRFGMGEEMALKVLVALEFVAAVGAEDHVIRRASRRGETE